MGRVKEGDAMKTPLWILAVALTNAIMILSPGGVAAQANPALAKAKKDAEAKGFQFVTSHDEIVANAKKEAALRVLHSFQPPAMNAMRDAFSKKYPFIKLSYEELTGTEAGQRFLLEQKAGVQHNWDVIHLSSDTYREHFPFLLKADLLGMAQSGVLQIIPKMIDPDTRNTMAASTTVGAVAYNKDLMPAAQVPKNWEDFLRPELKGKKFLVELRPNNLAALVPVMGKEWVLNYARKLAAQDPVWVRGVSKSLTSMAAGEHSLHQLLYWHNVAQFKNKARNIDLVLIEPVPVRLTEPYGIAIGSQHPYSAMLFLEFLSSAEGQKIIDDVEPLKSSMYFPGAKVEQAIRGKKVSLIDWKQLDDVAGIMQEIIAAYGFPKAER